MTEKQITDAEVRGLKPRDTAYKFSVGGGLHLLVQPNGSKLWRYAYRYDGKQKLLALGRYPSATLAEARRQRDIAKGRLADGEDPSAIRKASKAAKRPKPRQVRAVGTTFSAVASRWLGARDALWSSGYSQRVRSRVEHDLSPSLGDTPIDQISPQDVLQALRGIEQRDKLHTAQRVRRYAYEIFRFAKAEGLITGNPADDLGAAMKAPPPKKRRAALKATEVGDFLVKLDAYAGEAKTKIALMLALLTFVRTGELRYARWEEFEHLEGTEPLWRIPAERMKMRNPHVVPLSVQAVEALAQAKRLAGSSKLLFPATARDGVISENRMLYGMYRMGYHSRATVHGFRGTASTVLNENGFNRDWVERQLAHVEQDQVRAAYNAAEWLPQRRQMMQWWADWLDEQRTASLATA